MQSDAGRELVWLRTDGEQTVTISAAVRRLQPTDKEGCVLRRHRPEDDMSTSIEDSGGRARLSQQWGRNQYELPPPL